jgi:hypothetical protein
VPATAQNGGFYGQYTGSVASEKILGTNYAQFQSLRSFTGDSYTLVFKLRNGNYNRTVSFIGSRAKGLIITLDEAGVYDIEVFDPSGKSEGLLSHDGDTGFDVGPDGATFGDVGVGGGGLSGGAIAGIIIAVIAAVGALAFLVYWFKIRRNADGHVKLDSEKDEIDSTYTP